VPVPGACTVPNCPTTNAAWLRKVTLAANFVNGAENCVLGTFFYHYGPMCWAISATFGPIITTGSLTLTGAGFTEGYSATDAFTVSTFMCNVRIASICNGERPSTAPCKWPYYTVAAGTPVPNPVNLCPAAATTVGAATLSITLPAFPAQIGTENTTSTPPVPTGSFRPINPNWSGIRLFGDNARFSIMFRSTASPAAANTLECLANWNTGFAAGGNSPNGLAANRLDYRWGPIVRNVSPHKAEAGPRFAYLATPATVSGNGFSDPFITQRIQVGISHTGTATNTGLLMAGTASGDSITFSTLWGGSTDMYQDLTVFFDTCNSTTVYTDATYATQFSVRWGPTVGLVTYAGQTGVTDAKSEASPRCQGKSPVNLWGAKPWGGETITVNGAGFNQGWSLVGAKAKPIYCVIDQVSSLATALDTVNGLTVECKTPARDYWTNATILLTFGNTEIQGVADWTRWLRARQTLNYRPCVESIGATQGWTSGAQATPDVVVNGFGLSGWGTGDTANAVAWPAYTDAQAYLCMFGNYLGSLKAASVSATSITCLPPVTAGAPSLTVTSPGGAEFNTDVYVSVQLYNAPITTLPSTRTAGQIPFPWKIWAPTTYHFGPTCDGTDITRGYLDGNQAINIVGKGFADIRTIDKLQVIYGDPVSGTPIFVNTATPPASVPRTPGTNGITDTAIPITAAEWKAVTPNQANLAANCDSSPTLSINWILWRGHQNGGLIFPTPTPALAPITINTLCTPKAFTYGPTLTMWAVTAGAGAAFTNGWIGSKITVSGLSLNDPVLTAGTNKLAVTFGSLAAAAATGVTATSFNVVAPTDTTDNLWSTQYYDVTATWTVGSGTCTKKTTNQFIYGPELCNTSPSAGYVYGTAAATTGPTGALAKATVNGRGFNFNTAGGAAAGTVTYSCTWGLAQPQTCNPACPAPAATSSTSDLTYDCEVPRNYAVQNVATLQSMNVIFATGPVTKTRTSSTTSAFCTTKSLTYYYGPSLAAPFTLYSRIAGNTKLTINGLRLSDNYFQTTVTAGPYLWVRLGTGNLYVAGQIDSDTAVSFSTNPWGGKSCTDTDLAQPVWFAKVIAPVPGATVYTCVGNCACGTDPSAKSTGYCMPAVHTVVYGNPRSFKSAGASQVGLAGLAGGFTVTQNAYDIDAGAAFTCAKTAAPANCQNPWIDYVDDEFSTAVGGTTSGANRVLCVMGMFWSMGTVTPGATSTAVCPIPSGPFAYDGAVRLVLSPRNDYLTTVAQIFRWVPWSDRLSTGWAPEQTQTTVVAYGGDWMNYVNAATDKHVTVNCYFGGTQAWQADITDDYYVTCRTPQRALGVASVMLEFCDHKGDNQGSLSNILPTPAPANTSPYNNFCTCSYSRGYPDQANTTDSTTSQGTFVFAGVSGISPSSGPVQGNTVVTVSGAGLSFLNGLACVFCASSVTVPPTNSSSSVTCTTPKSSSPAITTFAVTGKYQGMTYRLPGPTCFEFGTPNVLSVSPTSLTTLEAAATLTLAGGANGIAGYFNGGSTFSCQITGTGSNSGFTKTLNAIKVADQSVTCVLPKGTFTQVGRYVVELVMDGTASTSRRSIDVTQNMVPTGLAPTSGSYAGGEQVVITGNNFNGGMLLNNVPVYFGRFGQIAVSCVFTPGKSNSTTAGNSTVISARRSDSIEERRRPFSLAQRSASARGTGDTLTCITPPGPKGTSVPVAISMDGFSWTPAGTFSYKDEAPNTTTSSPAGVVTLSMALAAVLAATVAMLM